MRCSATSITLKPRTKNSTSGMPRSFWRGDNERPQRTSHGDWRNVEDSPASIFRDGPDLSNSGHRNPFAWRMTESTTRTRHERWSAAQKRISNRISADSETRPRPKKFARRYKKSRLRSATFQTREGDTGKPPRLHPQRVDPSAEGGERRVRKWALRQGGGLSQQVSAKGQGKRELANLVDQAKALLKKAEACAGRI